MHYTSGTTGRSKGVWSGLWDRPTAAAAFVDEADQWAFGPEDVHLVCSPMHHSVSVRFAGGTLLRGGTCLILRHFDASAAAAALRGSRSRTHDDLHGPFGAQPPAGRCGGAGRSLRRPPAAGPCRVTVPARAQAGALERVGAGVAVGVLRLDRGAVHRVLAGGVAGPPGHRRPGPGGPDPDGRRRRDHLVPAPGLRPVQPTGGTRRRRTAAWRDGSFTVGDLGRQDGDGYLFLDGRRDDLIITGGVNVYPAEVEAVLGDVQGSARSPSSGVPDERWGQRVCVAVVPAAGSDRVGGSSVAAVRAHAADRLAGYKRPKQDMVVDALPRTATGKVQPRLSPAGIEPALIRRPGDDRRPDGMRDTGAMSPADAGPPIATVNPVNGELLQSFEPFDAAAVEACLATAATAPPAWAASTFAERSILLVTAAELLEGEVPDIAHVVTTEMGKPFAQAKGEVAKCASGFRWFAEHAERCSPTRRCPSTPHWASSPTSRWVRCSPSCRGTFPCGRWPGSSPRR